ncbi:MAG: metallophosphoesterase [Chthoniobacteraceae bacterium]
MPASEIQNESDFNAVNPGEDASVSQFTWTRIAIFLTVITTITMGANWLVCATWNHFMGNEGFPAWQIVPPLLTVTFIACIILGRRFSNSGLRLAYTVSATWMGVLNFSFFASMGAWIAWDVIGALPLHVEPRFVGVTFFAAAALASIYGIVNGSWLRTTRVDVKLRNLPDAWNGKSVALVTDMHLGNIRGAGFTRKVVARLQELKPEAVFISGDMFDGVEGDFDAFLQPWKQLSVPAGVYYVSGNHEEFEDRVKFLDAVKRAGIRVLNNEKVESNGLQIVGIHDGETHEPQLYKSLLQRAEVDRGRASVLLAHQPKNLEIPASEGIALQLSGHTHNGQIWPWHWLAARVHGKFVYGLHRFQAMQVLTSSGAGTWGIPMRAATKSEIVLIRLEGE